MDDLSQMGVDIVRLIDSTTRLALFEPRLYTGYDSIIRYHSSLYLDLLSLTVTLVLGNAFFILSLIYKGYPFLVWVHTHSSRFVGMEWSIF